MKFGTDILPDGVRFRFWAPLSERVQLKLKDRSEPLAMQRVQRGWFEIEVEGVGAGAQYQFILADGSSVPDPASRFQPGDVHGFSEVIDPAAYAWGDLGWRGRPWEEAVIYELHIGTFTPEGTFRSAIDKLDVLVELGITAIEIMPVADFPGHWNWGYDGVNLFAPDDSYGRPEDFKALIDAAHGKGLMVFLDVVYNHYGPDGNYIANYAPLFTEKHHTPWGAAVNYDDSGSSMVREFVLSNVRFWLNEYHLDGLRFDAVHEIRDDSVRHLLVELADQARSATDGRHVHLILENASNGASYLRRYHDGRPALFSAQWADDVHHGLHTALTGQSTGYYADYAGRLSLLGRALAEGFAYQGEVVPSVNKPSGEPSAHLPPTAFVSFLQNHDQIGNRPFGDRIGSLAPIEAVRAASAVLLLAPHIPLLFMGEEWNAPEPFPYFTDIQSLADAIHEGRAREFAGFFSGHGSEHEPPDPMVEETFQLAKLDWSLRDKGEHAESWAWFKALLDIRHREIVPRLYEAPGNSGRYEMIRDQGLKVSWTLGDGAILMLVANLSAQPLDQVEATANGRVLWTQGDAAEFSLGPWSLVWSLSQKA
jgi:maltooligosyltrehalose trehalohydrolase